MTVFILDKDFSDIFGKTCARQPKCLGKNVKGRKASAKDGRRRKLVEESDAKERVAALLFPFFIIRVVEEEKNCDK